MNEETQGQEPMEAAQAAQEQARESQSESKKAIGTEQIQEAQAILAKYKEGKANLDRRIIENLQWYRMRHWDYMEGNKRQVQPVTGWLFNAIANKHADAMDNFPSPNILPREEGDRAEAEMLSSIIPVIMQMDDFEETYDKVVDYELKTGTGVYGVFWDGDKLNGLGDVSIRKVDVLNLFWQSGIEDIQESPNLFSVQMRDNKELEEIYPELKNKLTGGIVNKAEKPVTEDNVDDTDKSTVVDWYYKKWQNGKRVLHFCKFVGNTVLFATENEPEYRERGWYDDGKYPYVFDPLFRQEKSPCGFGYIDVGKSAQEYIDRGNQAILENLLANVRPRHFIRADGSVNEEEYANQNTDFVHVSGTLGEDSIRPIEGKQLSGNYMTAIDNVINTLKETTGNRDISTGGTTSGVTAASAIAAMQEAGSKLSRDQNKKSYRAFRKVCLMVIERIRQFYDLPRSFRIIGADGQARYTQYTNERIQTQQATGMGEEDQLYRMPLFDIEITAQKASPYSRLSQNELALQFYQLGFFDPSRADQAIATLDMMDFDRKSQIMRKVQQNGTLMQMLQAAQETAVQLQAQIDQLTGRNDAATMQQQMMQGMAAVTGQAIGQGNAEDQQALGGEGLTEETAGTKQARQRVADSTAPG